MDKEAVWKLVGMAFFGAFYIGGLYILAWFILAVWPA